MGMHQYLEATCLVINDWQQKKVLETIQLPSQHYENSKVCVSVVVGRWDNAGMINDWFVNAVMGGMDDNGSYLVSEEVLEDLKKDCENVLQALSNGDQSVAEDLIPNVGWWSEEGYGEYYIEEIQRTLRVVIECLAFSNEWDFKYSSHF